MFAAEVFVFDSVRFMWVARVGINVRSNQRPRSGASSGNIFLRKFRQDLELHSLTTIGPGMTRTRRHPN
jgi:hypothetical protein